MGFLAAQGVFGEGLWHQPKAIGGTWQNGEFDWIPRKGRNPSTLGNQRAFGNPEPLQFQTDSGENQTVRKN